MSQPSVLPSGINIPFMVEYILLLVFPFTLCDFSFWNIDFNAVKKSSFITFNLNIWIVYVYMKTGGESWYFMDDLCVFSVWCIKRSVHPYI